MNTHSDSCSQTGGSCERERTPPEAAACIAGTLAGAAQAVMSIRMWITLAASVLLIVGVLQSESLLHIAKWFCVFAALMAVLFGSALFAGKRAG